VLTAELRQLFLDFFRSKDHHIEPSAPLIPPADDKSLLLINAGMAPLKPYFLGLQDPPSSRMASVQRCLRTNDIDEVGKTPRHLTCFEMLGNFSFGDYFKKEIIHWSWEFLREWVKIPVEKLRVSVFEDDDEAFNIWAKEIGVREDWIYRLGEKDNFWFMADTGPCGPDTEIFYDIGEDLGPNDTPATGGDRWVEIWNLVFTQFDRQPDGTLNPLPKKNVDTGMGLERTSMALQGHTSVFETDSYKPIIDIFRDATPPDILLDKKYMKGGVNSLYVVADHIRAIVMLIADGVYPSNEGRGYILRRLLRRALVHLMRLEQENKSLLRAFDPILDMWGNIYPNIVERKDHIEKLVKVEEDNFRKMIETESMRLFGDLHELKNSGVSEVPGDRAFDYYETRGVPLEVIEEQAATHGLSVDVAGFNAALEKAKEKSRAVTGELLDKDQRSKDAVKSKERSEFTGYGRTVEVSALVEYDPEHNFVVLDKSPFYAESGGQIGDTGILRFDGGSFTVIDTQRKAETIVHQIDPEKTTGDPANLAPGDPIEARVDEDRRKAIRRAHTATHLLHAALRETLGDHVQQAGSLVEPDRFRFDFSHYQPLTDEEKSTVEDMVNKNIFAEYDVHYRTVPIAEAKTAGAMMLFGEKYGKDVRMVWIGGRETMPTPDSVVSTELCGGTHVDNTGVIGQMIITSEESVASGVRRIEAVTGKRAYELARRNYVVLQSISDTLNIPSRDLERGIIKFSETLKKLEQEKKNLEQRLASGTAGAGQAEEQKIGDFNVLIMPVEQIPADTASKILDKMVESGSAVLAFSVVNNEGSGWVLVRCNESAVKAGAHAGKILKQVAEAMGGKGGGKPTFAQGGVDPSKYEEGKTAFINAVKSI
jgi:alanyl-tRNA synthetase